MDYIKKSSDRNQKGSSRKSVGSENPTANLRIIDTDLEPEDFPGSNRQKSINRKRLVDKLNYINFEDETVQIRFEYKEDNRVVEKTAKPQPCFGKYLLCLWTDPFKDDDIFDRLIFMQMRVVTVHQVINVPAKLRAVSKSGICLELPEKSLQHSSRKATRYRCRPLEVELIQNGAIFQGTLMDFSAFAFRIEIKSSRHAPVQWMNAHDPLNLIIKKESETLYTGDCKIIKRDDGIHRRQFILAPLKETIQRFTPRVYRSRRIDLSPSPDIRFHHPLTDKTVNLKILDLSGSGISVEDDEENSFLFPGLIIPVMELDFSNSFLFTCRAQVIYRRIFKNDRDQRIVKCGIVFLDIDPDDHMKFLSILHQAENRNLCICNKVDINELWRFFFETGFIYPRKYALIRPQKEQIKKTYQTLYSKQSNIARHFTWQKKGSINAHLSMLRFYEKTWLVHHLAARTSPDTHGASLDILNQIGAFTYDSHRMISSNMDYLICYFRPDNRFSEHFFGGVAKNIDNSRACSIHAFAYMLFNSGKSNISLPKSWTLDKPDYNDLSELENHYESSACELMLRSLDLLPEDDLSDRFDLASEYQKLGLIRERRIYALKQNNRLVAILMANITNPALNLSDLTNCINIFILDEKSLTPEILESTLSRLSKHYAGIKFPVLIYPLEYTRKHAVAFDRTYNLWSMNMQHTDDYFKQYFYLS